MKNTFILIIGFLFSFSNNSFAEYRDTLTIRLGGEDLRAFHLVKGELNLYKVEEFDIGVGIDIEGQFQEAKVSKYTYFLEVEKILILVHSGNYKKIVKKYLPNAPDLHKRLGKQGFRFENLQQMVEFYNKFRIDQNPVAID